VKANFLRTMKVTVADPAGRSHRSPVQFFAFKSHSEWIAAYVYGSANKQKQLWEFNLVMFHMQSKLTVRLTLQFVFVSPFNVCLGQANKTFFEGLDFCFVIVFYK